ncbi:MAG: hypothetical protein ABMA64_13320 [Myxococcota bacterium]
MRVFGWGMAGLVACSSATIKDEGSIGTYPNDAPDADADSDTDSDTDTDADADSDADTDTEPTLDTGEPCEVMLLDQFPLDGGTDVYVGTELWFVLSIADPGATVSLEDLAGNVVAGSVTHDGVRVNWAGDPLQPNTEYVSTFTWTCGSQVSHFTTSDVGEPLSVDPTGLVYSIQLESGLWVEPPLVGPLFAAQLGDNDLMVSPASIGATTIDLLGVYGTYDVQDVCIPTVPFDGLAWDDPTFTLVSPSVPLDVGGFSVEITDVEVEGSFAADGSRIQFGTLRGLIDTRNLGPAIGLGGAPDAVCFLVGTLGVACEPCPDALDYCLAITVSDLEAPGVAGGVVERTVDDILADPSCP